MYKKLAQIVAFAGVGLLLASAGDARAGACPNEASRGVLGSALLPDCRAYELVSPTAKNGQPVEAKLVSPDGAHVVSSSIGGFPGSNQVSILNFYGSGRGPSGWETTPLNVPVGYFDPRATVLLAASPDLNTGLFSYKLSTTEDLRDTSYYLSTLPTGTPVKVGPLLSRKALESNGLEEPVNSSEPSLSGNLSVPRVVFMLEGPETARGAGLVDYLWPGDTTTLPSGGSGLDSLYEYVGTGHTGIGSDTPARVGVSDGTTVVNGKALAAGELISQCGTSLGFPARGHFTSLGGGGDYYNAVSSSSAAQPVRIFFTAAGATQGLSQNACNESGEGSGPPADEILAREEVPSTGITHTVAISEPTSGAAGDCSGCNTAEPANAVFQGASKDGSRVFFLSEQHLLLGSEGENLYEYDFNAEAGRHLALVAPNMQELTPSGRMQGVVRVSEDGSHVYFVAKSVLTGTSNPVGSVAQSGADNLYVYDTAARQTSFIGTLSEADEEEWQQEDLRRVDAAPDGRFLVFRSSADLTPGDTSSVPQVFEYGAQPATLVLASRPQHGTAASEEDLPASIVLPEYNFSSNPAPQPTSVSDSGGVVVFQSEAALTPKAKAGDNNVYEYSAGVVSLISDGQDDSHGQGGIPTTRLVGVSSSGDDIFFTTADRLVPQDGDTQEDLYDARVDGGFLPSQGSGSCEGEGCQGALAAAPLLSSVGSTSQAPGDQVVEAPSRPKGKEKAKHTKKKAKRRKRARKARHGAGRLVRRRGH